MIVEFFSNKVMLIPSETLKTTWRCSFLELCYTYIYIFSAGRDILFACFVIFQQKILEKKGKGKTELVNDNVFFLNYDT